MKDYYKILGVKSNASLEEIKQNFKRLAQIYHPDKTGGDDERFKEINEAYQILTDHWNRSDYDRNYSSNKSSKEQPKAEQAKTSNSSEHTKKQDSTDNSNSSNKATKTPPPKKNYQKVGGVVGSIIFISIIHALTSSSSSSPIVNTSADNQTVIPTSFQNNTSQTNCGTGYVSDDTSQCVEGNQYCVGKNGVGAMWDGSSCNCQAGYNWNNAKTKCLTDGQYCKEQNGKFGVYNSTSNSCDCAKGYFYSTASNKCVSHNTLCSEKFLNSTWDGNYCSCANGYTWNSDQTACIVVVPETNDQICKDRNGPFGIYNSSDNTCGCADGYNYGAISKQCVTFIASRDENCASSYPNTNFLKFDPTSEKNICDCVSGYFWNNDRTACVNQTTLNQSCVNSYGQGSFSTTENGKNVCDCSSNYTWNLTRKSCITNASIDQLCLINTGRNSHYLGYVQNGKYMCSDAY